KQNLKAKGIIDKYEIILNYKKININCFVLALVKIMPKAFRRYEKGIGEILSNSNIISLINVPQTSITHIILFGFKDIDEYDSFFRYLQAKLPGLLEIKESYVFSNESFLKNSSADLFLKAIKEFGDKRTNKPELPEIDQTRKNKR
ncbi:MAG: hypothetical protein ABIJ08_06410, partial [Nanoarchaeota archaeon]